MNFICDTSTTCFTQTGGTLYVGDYLPDTIPYAAGNNVSTIEVYFCDWEFAYNNTKATSLGCQASDTANGNAYATILNNP